MKRAIEFGAARTSDEEKLKGAREAPYIADTEAWRIARAFLTRSQMERLKWEEVKKKRYMQVERAQKDGKQKAGEDGLRSIEYKYTKRLSDFGTTIVDL